MKKIKEISKNDLGELIGLMSSIESELHRYSHVKEHLPISLKKEIEKVETALNKEWDRREDEI